MVIITIYIQSHPQVCVDLSDRGKPGVTSAFNFLQMTIHVTIHLCTFMYICLYTASGL